jgi:hypothetical protein
MGSGRGVQRDRDGRSREVQRAVTVRSMRSSISLFAGRASLLRIKKFPVRVHGNLLAKWLTLRGFPRCQALKKCPEMRNFPVIFTQITVLPAETGSYMTASSANV